MTDYLVPACDADAELVEKKSRFIAHIFRVETEEEALSRLKEMRDRYWDATHNVYAYILAGGQARYSDDGEPGGTAGMPVLEVLKGAGVYQVCCVVTRYFGGTLLGTGGLVRAYGKSAKLGLEAAGICRRCTLQGIRLDCSYSLYEQLRRELAARGGILTNTDFGSSVTIEACFEQASIEGLFQRIRDISSGTVVPELTETETRDIPVEF